MNILGLDVLTFGVDDVAACSRYLTDYGLKPIDVTEQGGRFEALDGTAVVLAHLADATLPPTLGTPSFLRKTTYGVKDAATLDAIAAELGRDREVKRLADGSLESTDDMGFTLGFQLSVRRPLQLDGELSNAPGAAQQRPLNHLGVVPDLPALPRTLSHVVYFVPDAVKAEAFYVQRLGFVCTDRFTGVGPFLRPAGMADHHALFMIQTPPFMKGVEHFTFHVGGPTEMMTAGTRLIQKGYKPFWGPGRHIMGSNWFWYFTSPLRCNVEYDADMDQHDDSWVARELPMGADHSQTFLFQHREKWAPSGPPPGSKDGPPPGSKDGPPPGAPGGPPAATDAH